MQPDTCVTVCVCWHAGASGDILPLTSSPLKLISLKTKAGTPVYCSAISHNASLIAYSDGEALRLYSITLVIRMLSSDLLYDVVKVLKCLEGLFSKLFHLVFAFSYCLF